LGQQGYFGPGEDGDEENISAQQSQEKENPRLSRENEDEGGQEGLEQEEGQRTQEDKRLRPHGLEGVSGSSIVEEDSFFLGLQEDHDPRKGPPFRGPSSCGSTQ